MTIQLDRTAFNALVDEPLGGDNTTGSRWDKAAIDTTILDPVDVALASLETTAGTSVVLLSTTGVQTDWAIPGRTSQTLLNWTGTADLVINGIANPVLGDTLTITNGSSGTGIVYLIHQAAANPTVANRLFLVATSAGTALAKGGWARLLFNGFAWILIGHDQGVWVAPAFSAAAFSANGAMTWSVDAGDVSLLRFRLSGKTLTVAFTLATTSVGGTPSTELRLLNLGWGSYTVAGPQWSMPFFYSDNSGAYSAGFAQAGSNLGGTNWIGLYKAGAAAWTASTNATVVQGEMTFEVN